MGLVESRLKLTRPSSASHPETSSICCIYVTRSDALSRLSLACCDACCRLEDATPWHHGFVVGMLSASSRPVFCLNAFLIIPGSLYFLGTARLAVPHEDQGKALWSSLNLVEKSA